MFDIKKRNEEVNPLKTFHKKFESLFDQFFSDTSMSLVNLDFAPKVDITEDEKAIIVKAELPGMTEKDIDVSIKNNVFTISGEKKDEKETKNEKEHRIERSFGSFSRSFTLPDYIEADKIKAVYKNGVLNVEIPKSEKTREKTVKIDVQ